MAALAIALLDFWYVNSTGDLAFRNLRLALIFWPITWLVTLIVAALPAFLMAGCVLAIGIPRGVGEMAAGAIIGLACMLPFAGVDLSVFLSEAATYAVSGALAGLTYRLLAGRPKNARQS